RDEQCAGCRANDWESRRIGGEGADGHDGQGTAIPDGADALNDTCNVFETNGTRIHQLNRSRSGSLTDGDEAFGDYRRIVLTGIGRDYGKGGPWARQGEP